MLAIKSENCKLASFYISEVLAFEMACVFSDYLGTMEREAKESRPKENNVVFFVVPADGHHIAQIIHFKKLCFAESNQR